MECPDDDDGKKGLRGRAIDVDLSKIILSDEEVIQGFLAAHSLDSTTPAGEKWTVPCYR